MAITSLSPKFFDTTLSSARHRYQAALYLANLMAIPANLKPHIEHQLQDRITQAERLGGGDIAEVFSLRTRGGQRYVLKHGEHLPDDMFSAEAGGLAALADTGCIRTPAVIAVNRSFLILELFKSRVPDEHYWSNFGRQLALLHLCPAKLFGFDTNNYCGATPQPNPVDNDGYRFFAEQRLLYQARLAFNRSLLSSRDIRAIEQLCNRLPDLIPRQPPSLIHGDLWRGNQLCDENDNPVLIDPACYYGWAEAELAMTQLFGGFDEAF
ncbi:MAG: hypothetical protein EP334_04360, partial [Gammaproteobacteria bacterium]